MYSKCRPTPWVAGFSQLHRVAPDSREGRRWPRHRRGTEPAPAGVRGCGSWPALCWSLLGAGPAWIRRRPHPRAPRHLPEPTPLPLRRPRVPTLHGPQPPALRRAGPRLPPPPAWSASGPGRPLLFPAALAGSLFLFPHRPQPHSCLERIERRAHR